MARLSGFTKDNDGNLLPSVVCNVFKDNLDGTCTFIEQVTSDAVTAAYLSDAAPDTLPQYFVVSWKDGTPHVFDCTDHILQPRAESGRFVTSGSGDLLFVGLGAGVGGTGDIFMDGTGAMNLVVNQPSPIAIVGTGDLQLVGGPVASGDFSSTGTGDALMTAPSNFFTAGVGDMQMVGQGNAPMSMVGAGTMAMAAASGAVELASDPFAGLLDPLSASWTVVSSVSFTQVGGQATTSGDGGDNEAMYTGITWPNDQYSKCVMGVTAAPGLGAGYGVFCRLTESGGVITGYRLIAGNDGWELLRFVSDASTLIANSTGTTFDDGDELYLQFVGTAWTVKKNGSTVSGGTGTDANISAGNAGIAYSSTAAATDGIASWAGGTP